MISSSTSTSSFSLLPFASPSKPLDQHLGIAKTTNLLFSSDFEPSLRLRTSRKPLTVKAIFSDDERSSGASLFVSGFVLGGVLMGALGCVFAPQISEALAKADKKDLMKKLPKFIYDEEKALEKTRKTLTQKINELNSAIDDISSQLHSGDDQNELAENLDEVPAGL